MSSMTTSLWNCITLNSTLKLEATSIIVKNVVEKSTSSSIKHTTLASSKLPLESSVITSRPPSYTSFESRYTTRALIPSFHELLPSTVKVGIEGEIVSASLAKNELKFKLRRLRLRGLKPVVVVPIPQPSTPSKPSKPSKPSPSSSSSPSTKVPYYTPGLSWRARRRRRLAKLAEVWPDPDELSYDDVRSILYRQQLRDGTNFLKYMSEQETMMLVLHWNALRRSRKYA